MEPVHANWLVTATTAVSCRAGVAAGFAAACTARLAGNADQLDASDALGNRNSLHSGATALVDNTNAFAAGDFLLYASQLQPGRLAAAAAVILGWAAGCCGGSAATIGKAGRGGTQQGSRKGKRQDNLRHQTFSKQ